MHNDRIIYILDLTIVGQYTAGREGVCHGTEIKHMERNLSDSIAMHFLLHGIYELFRSNCRSTGISARS